MKLPTIRRVRTNVEGIGSIPHAPSRDAAAPAFEPTPLDFSTLVVANADFVFRVLRRAGLDVATAEDGAQQVFLVAARKLGRIGAGKERAFLYAAATRVAADLKRKASRRRELPFSEEDFDDLASGPFSSPDRALEQQRARELLDEVLSGMPDPLRDVFVLSELEDMSASEVAALLAIPSGTVASRLARARRVFDEILARIEARRAFRSRA